MSDRPKSMDDLAAGMRGAAATAADRDDSPCAAGSIRASRDVPVEAAIAYVAEQLKFVEVWPGACTASARANRWYRVGVDGFKCEGAPALSVMMPKPTPEPPDAVREALVIVVHELARTTEKNPAVEHALDIGRAALDADG